MTAVSILIAMATLGAEPAPLPSAYEPAWSKWIASEYDGIAEWRAPDGVRVDVLTDNHAWEVEWIGPKVYEAVGQAIYYKASTQKHGGVILLMGRKPAEQEIVWYLRALVMCREAGLALKTVNVKKVQ